MMEIEHMPLWVRIAKKKQHWVNMNTLRWPTDNESEVMAIAHMTLRWGELKIDCVNMDSFGMTDGRWKPHDGNSSHDPMGKMCW